MGYDRTDAVMKICVAALITPEAASSGRIRGPERNSMNRFRIEKLPLLAGLLVAAWPGVSRASGFLLYEQSASALGRGSAVVASEDEPAAAFYNPAALPFGAPAGVALSGMLIRPETRFQGDDGVTTNSLRHTWALPALYAHATVTPRVHLGLAINVPFGMAVAWPKDWPASHFAVNTNISVFELNPSVAVRLHDRVALAAGVRAVRGAVTMSARLPAIMNDALAELDGTTWGAGANLGLLVRLWPERLHLGATYRSRVRLKFDGQAHFTPEIPEMGAVTQGARSTITLPDLIVLGALVRATTGLDLGAEVSQTRWSTFNRLAVDFDQPNVNLSPVDRSRRNPLSVRLGAQYALPRVAVALRTGFSFDQSSATAGTISPSGPDANRLGFCVGMGARVGRVGVDVGYMRAQYLEARANPPPLRSDGFDPAQSLPGRYRSAVNQLALTISVLFAR
jgi:long-chain fatty acid transport protein